MLEAVTTCKGEGAKTCPEERARAIVWLGAFWAASSPLSQTVR